jgi:hypothetical protein
MRRMKFVSVAPTVRSHRELPVPCACRGSNKLALLGKVHRVEQSKDHDRDKRECHKTRYMYCSS